MTEPENQPVTTPSHEPVVPHPPAPEEHKDAVETHEASTESESTTMESTEDHTHSNDMVSGDEAMPATMTETKSPIKWQYYAGAAVVLAIIILGVLYAMDRQGRMNIPLFDGIENFAARQTAVASVNGADISEYDFNVSVAQITAGAEAQGADLSSPELQTQINSQAIEMLVNTELLKQEAARRGISITDEDVSNRLTSLEEEVGGADVLKERMAQFNINDKTLRRDILNELTIQALLDQVFEETDINVTDEEIQSLYAGAGGEEAGLPPLEEVREQVIEQIRGGKEQEIVSTFIATLRETATIEILI